MGKKKKKNKKRKPTVIELEQKAGEILKEKIKELEVPKGSLAKLMEAMVNTAKIGITNRRIQEWPITEGRQETTVLQCLIALDSEGMLNREGKALAMVAQQPSVHS